MIILQAEWSQRPVLKSNLQTPTWLLPISHGLFITAITSPHIFILLLHCCWPALLSLSFSIWLTSPLSLHPNSPLFFFDLQQPVQPIPRPFPHTFLSPLSHPLFPSARCPFFQFHLWMHLSPCRLFAIISLIYTQRPNNCHLLQQPWRFLFTFFGQWARFKIKQHVQGPKG